MHKSGFGGIMHGIDYIALYLSVAFMCMALEFMMALKMNTNVVSTAEVVIFRRLTTFSITEILTQCLWLIDSAPRFQFPRPVQYGYNLIDLICTGLICYFWYRFVDMNLTPRENLLHRRKIETVFGNIPIITLVTVDCMSLLNHKVFYVSAAGNYIRGPWYFIQVACCFAYCLIVIITLIRSQIRHTLNRRIFLVYFVFTIFPSLGGILQVMLPGPIPIAAIFFALGMFLMFSELQNRQINTDALTGLNNRAKTSAYLAARIPHAGREPFCLFMADIDYFKQINDRYGHVMGDNALALVADAFRALAKSYRTFFVSRYGGDEFLFTVSLEETSPEDLMKAFSESLKNKLEASDLPFQLNVSMGYTIAYDSDLTEKQLISRADASLYTAKNQNHLQR